MSSHVSWVLRGPPRPSPIVCGGRGARVPNAGAGLPAGSRGRAAGPGVGVPGRGRVGLAPGTPLGVPSWFGARGVLFIISLTARPTRGRARRAPRLYWGAGVATRALFACGTTAGRQAAILSPRLLSLVGGAEPCAITPTGLDVEAAGGGGPGTHRCVLGPDGCFSPCRRPEALLGRRNRLALGGRRSFVQVLSPNLPWHSPPPPPLLSSISPFLLQSFQT